MNNSERLFAASSFIETGDIVCDVGCDHGYLALLGLEKGAKRFDLIDNKIGPLSRSKLNTKDIYDGKNINYYLSDGLDNLNSDVNKIFILGMGGELITSIIDKNKDKIQKEQILVLDAHVNQNTLRKYLFDNYFLIKEEIIIKEKNIFYELMIVQRSDELVSYNELDLIFGPHLRRKKEPLFIEKWTKILNKYLKIKELNQTNELDLMIERIKDVL